MLGSTVASVIINNFINELSCSETWYHWEEVRYYISPIREIPFYASYKVFVSLSIFCQMLLADWFFYFFFHNHFVFVGIRILEFFEMF